MINDTKSIDLTQFFPLDKLEIKSVNNTKKSVIIKLKSKTKSCECPKCHTQSQNYHGTYVRKVQDLPLWGKKVTLVITSHEYKCDNENCQVTTIAESYDGFLNYYSRMTERLEAFICALALETSCEGCARICNKLGIKISGDTVIRHLIKRYENQPAFKCGSIIGVDDFAFKKRHNYGTIIVDEKTHKPVTILNGRDGKSLQQWLKHNKHVKIVTRDRASAYAKVIAEEIPNAMQVADRFHLHQNLLDAIKKALNREIPATTAIPHQNEKESKKNAFSCG